MSLVKPKLKLIDDQQMLPKESDQANKILAALEEQIKDEQTELINQHSSQSSEMYFTLEGDYRQWDSNHVQTWLTETLKIESERLNLEKWAEVGVNGKMLEMIDDTLLKDVLDVRSKLIRKFIIQQVSNLINKRTLRSIDTVVTFGPNNRYILKQNL